MSSDLNTLKAILNQNSGTRPQNNKILCADCGKVHDSDKNCSKSINTDKEYRAALSSLDSLSDSAKQKVSDRLADYDAKNIRPTNQSKNSSPLNSDEVKSIENNIETQVKELDVTEPHAKAKLERIELWLENLEKQSEVLRISKAKLRAEKQKLLVSKDAAIVEECRLTGSNSLAEHVEVESKWEEKIYKKWRALGIPDDKIKVEIENMRRARNMKKGAN